MAIEKPAPWVGASGQEYTFHVFGLEADVPARLGGYIYARRNAEGAWVPIYMGHGDLATRCTDAALSRCIATKGATHVHLRLNGREADREAELQDLLAHYANAFAPEGCHARQAVVGAEAPPRSRKSTSTAASTKKAPAKETPAKKTPTKKTPVKKTPAKKAATKKASPKQRPVSAKTPRPRSK